MVLLLTISMMLLLVLLICPRLGKLSQLSGCNNSYFYLALLESYEKGAEGPNFDYTAAKGHVQKSQGAKRCHKTITSGLFNRKESSTTIKSIPNLHLDNKTLAAPRLI